MDTWQRWLKLPPGRELLLVPAEVHAYVDRTDMRTRPRPGAEQGAVSISGSGPAGAQEWTQERAELAAELASWRQRLQLRPGTPSCYRNRRGSSRLVRHRTSERRRRPHLPCRLAWLVEPCKMGPHRTLTGLQLWRKKALLLDMWMQKTQ